MQFSRAPSASQGSDLCPLAAAAERCCWGSCADAQPLKEGFHPSGPRVVPQSAVQGELVEENTVRLIRCQC